MTRISSGTLGAILATTATVTTAPAFAEAPQPMASVGDSLAVESSRRGVAQDYMVIPEGATELTGQMRLLTSDALFTDDTGTAQPLKFSDMALFGLTVRRSLFSKLELTAHVDLLPKQPAYTSEKAWQSVAFGVRSPIGNTVAVSLGGSGGHLISHDGSWLRQSFGVQFKKPLHDIMQFDVRGGADTTVLVRDQHAGGWLTELGVSGQVLFRDPHGHVGAWAGLGYAIPVAARGYDPTTDLKLDPQNRLDFRVGAVVSIVKNWDVFVEYAVVDRGELSDAATRLPILDGGFDQQQAIFGVARHFSGSPKQYANDDDDAMQLSSR